MAEEARKLSLENVSDAIRILNESTRGMSFQWQFDFIGFMNFALYWNISFEHTLIGYFDGEPAALIINTVDPDTRSAYTVYWGSLPKFRTRRISLKLLEMSCDKLHNDGYIDLYATSVPDRPLKRYRFVRAVFDGALFDMQAEIPHLPPVDPDLVVREVDVNAISQLVPTSGERFVWVQRHTFLRGAASYLQFLGAFSGDMLMAYVVSVRKSDTTSILDLRCSESSDRAGFELIRYLASENYRPPLRAYAIFEHSYAHRLLTAAGFTIKKQFASLLRHLPTTSQQRRAS